MPRAKPPLLILGATSLIGECLLPLLDEAGVDYLAASRQQNGPSGLRLDLSTTAGLADLPDLDQALCLAPIWLLTPATLAALKARGLRRLVVVSSTSVLGKATSPDPKEQAVVAALNAGEAAVRASQLDWTILRPTLIYLEGRDGNVSRLAGLIRRFGILPISGLGLGRRQPVHAADLAKVALTALDTPASIGKVYALAGGDTLTYREMVERIFAGLGKRPRIVSLPPWLWRAILRVASPFMKGTSAQIGARMEQDLVFDDRAARHDLGWQPRGFAPRF